MEKIKIFVSYSHQNEDWVSDEGKYKLIPWLKRQLEDQAEIWTDHALKSLLGEEYTKLITEKIFEADFALLLISQDFVSSSYIMKVELPLIHKRYEKKKIKILSLLLTNLTMRGKEKVNWIFDLQTYPNDTKPLLSFIKDDDQWENIKVDILDGIETKIVEINQIKLREELDFVVIDDAIKNDFKEFPNIKEEFLLNEIEKIISYENQQENGQPEVVEDSVGEIDILYSRDNDILTTGNGKDCKSEESNPLEARKVAKVIAKVKAEKHSKSNESIEKYFVGDSGFFIDERDSNKYKWLRIGKQIWMGENLAFKVTRGCWAYNNDINNVEKFGYLYDWNNALNQCPKGWHLPSDEDWVILENYMIESGYNYDGSIVGNKIGKALAESLYWAESEEIGTLGNSSQLVKQIKFCARPGGYRYYDGAFYDFGRYGGWWSSTKKSNSILIRSMSFQGKSLKSSNSFDDCAFSVRCILT